jgi:hypothetical protein
MSDLENLLLGRFLDMTTIKLGLAGLMAAALLAAVGCRRVDSSESASMATKPVELFSTDAKKRCLERAAQLSLNQGQQSTLCEGATSSAPVDCFRKKTQNGGSPESIIGQCKGGR